MSKHRFRRGIVGLLIAIAAVGILYLGGVNLLLGTEFLRSALNRDPDRLSVEWSSARTLFPGAFSVEGLRAKGKTRRQAWNISVEDARARLALLPLLSRTVRIARLEADSVAFGLRKRVDETVDRPSPPLSQARDPQRLEGVSSDEATIAEPHQGAASGAGPATVAAPPPETVERGPGWKFVVGSAEITGIRRLELNDARFIGEAQLLGEGTRFQIRGPVSVGDVQLELSSGELAIRSEPFLRNLRVDGDLRLEPFSPAENPGLQAARFVSGSVAVTGDMTAFYDFLDRYLTERGWLRLRGGGALNAALRIAQGELIEGTTLTIESPDLAVEIDPEHAPGPRHRYRIQGGGNVRGEVRSRGDELDTELRVALREVVMDREPEDQVLLSGERFELTAVTGAIDLAAGAPGEPTVAMVWRDATMPDVAMVTDYLPVPLPFSLRSGSARLNGQARYADQVASGAFELAGEEITGAILGEDVVGQLNLELVIPEYAPRERRLDLSGTRIRMEAATSDAGAPAGESALVSELKILEARLAHESPAETPPQPEDTRLPVTGTLRIEGEVANIGFLNGFFPNDSTLALGGDGRVAADLEVREGRLEPGSTLEVASDNLMSRFLDFEVTGAGTVNGDVGSAAEKREARLRVALRDVAMRARQQDRVLLTGEKFQLMATSPVIDLETPLQPSIVVELADAIVPDVSVLNSYIPGRPPFSLDSGSAVMNGRLEYADKVVIGTLGLDGKEVTGTLFDEQVVGQLDVDLVIDEIDLEARRVDLSGTRVRMQAAAGGADPDQQPLQTELDLVAAQLGPVYLGGESRTRPRRPINGALKLTGRVANIDFLNSFMPADHRLRFAGNGVFSADLKVSEGQVSPGSAMEVRSDRLTGRFLDYEANGLGLLNASVDGTPRAPTAKVDLFLSNLSLRRLDEAAPYIEGHNLELTTVGQRFDTRDGLRDLDTNIKIFSAEIPDISIYNDYLPEDAGIAIKAGKGGIKADLRLKGVAGSGMLELQARDVEIQLRDQLVKGKLTVTTRLREGNLEDMTFDVSGSQVRIDDGRLENALGGTVQDRWWGRIDLEQGRMTWKRPLDLDAELALKLRDSGLLVNMFVKQTQKRKWLDELLTIKDVTGRGGVLLDDKTLTLKDAKLTGEELLVLANLRLRDKQAHGALFASYGILSVGVELRGEERKWKILRPRQWYDDFTRRLTAQQP